jgi:hypothetical protein
MEAAMRVIIAVTLALTMVATPSFAGQNEDTNKSGGRKGAIVGALVGLGAGIAGAALYGVSQNTLCENAGGSDNYSPAGCYLPMAGMIGGGATAGYFIGRHVDRRPERNSSFDRPVGMRKPFTIAAPSITLTATKP